MTAGAYGTDRGDETGWAKADDGVHNVAAVAGMVANEAAGVATAGVACDAVSAHERIASSGIGQVEEATSCR